MSVYLKENEIKITKDGKTTYKFATSNYLPTSKISQFTADKNSAKKVSFYIEKDPDPMETKEQIAEILRTLIKLQKQFADLETSQESRVSRNFD